MKNILLILIIALFTPVAVFAQAGGAGVKVTGDDAYADSLRNTPYPYKLPILGKNVQKRGFTLPYPIGVMVNTYAGVQDVNISDLKVGFNGGTMYSLDSIVKFKETKAHAQNINVRVDAWILPFFNIYGIIGATWVQTEIELSSPIELSAEEDFQGFSYGLGGTVASGINNWFFTADYNCAWSQFPQMKSAVNTQMLSPRIGYTFHFSKRDRNIAVWLGATYLILNKTTEGDIYLKDVAPDLTGDKLETIINSSKSDYPDMSLAQYELMKTVAGKLEENLPEINDEIDKTIVSYSLKKRPTHNFTGLIGAQFQPNKRWQFRTEIGLLGGRYSGLLSANYRFGF